ncbi:MAG: glycosyltransferase family 4 protein [Actinobacteria bacterium]|nr:glycosyltransferase family 4 protein [Actinomycetota bacterium]
MAGPAIRYWEFAKVISKHHEVTLATKGTCDIDHPDFEVVSLNNRSLSNLIGGQDVLIAQSITPGIARLARSHHVKLLVDAYDPIPLETLEAYADEDPRIQIQKSRASVLKLRLWLHFADAILCATERQRDLWLGSMMALNLIAPSDYFADKSFRNRIDVVSFGLPSQDPSKTGPGFRETLRIEPDWPMAIWAGGIWNWLDPLTPIRAIAELKRSGMTAALVFMGIKRPAPAFTPMDMAGRAISLAKELDLYDKQVFFNQGWVPYEERQNYLLQADLGVSAHLDHLETRFSFRTRILDYIWTTIPIVATEGDAMADIVQSEGLGFTVPYQDGSGFAQRMKDLLSAPDRLEETKANLRRIRASYTWEKVCEPLLLLIDLHTEAKPRPLSSAATTAAVSYYPRIAREVVQTTGWRSLLRYFFIEAGLFMKKMSGRIIRRG